MLTLTTSVKARSRTVLQANPLPVQMPIGAEDPVEGVIDLDLEMQADLYDEVMLPVS